MLKDPSQVAIKNNQLFGLNIQLDDAQIVALGIPWDVTTSYRPGTVDGPSAILEASYQLDLVSPILPNAWELPLHTLTTPTEWAVESRQLRVMSQQIIAALESGVDLNDEPNLLKDLETINLACSKLTAASSEIVKSQLSAGRKVLCIGGDHATSLGPIKAYSNKYSDLSILHFDAHADLRKAYEGFHESHASIMFNVMETLPIHSLVQVGIRDVSPTEIAYIQSNSKIYTHFDWTLKSQLSLGQSWDSIADQIIRPLSSHVYISFDIDGLDPKLCPNTGTPVPGGLELWQAQILIEKIVKSGRKIVGADLVEVAPGPNGDQWDGNVGARCAFILACAITRSIE